VKPKLYFVGNSHLHKTYKQAAMMRFFKIVDIEKADLVFIAQDVNNDAELLLLDELIRNTRPYLLDDTPLVVLSQVPPGYTRKIDWNPVIYQVETLITSDRQELYCALHPARIICGTKNGIKDRLPEPYKRYLKEFSNNIIHVSWEAAELAKAAINVFLASSIDTANMMYKVATKLGVDWNDVVPALRSDRRIGGYAYILPGEFGPHLQRDWDRMRKLA